MGDVSNTYLFEDALFERHSGVAWWPQQVHLTCDSMTGFKISWLVSPLSMPVVNNGDYTLTKH